jgi:lipoprotein-releasing system permease protein
MLLTVSIVMGFKSEIVKKITGLTTDIAISSVNVNSSNEPDPITINPDTLRLIRELPFVKHLQMIAFKNGLLKTDTDNEGILLKGVGSDYDFSFISEHLVQGTIPDFDLPSVSPEILVSEVLTRKMDLHLGDRILVYFISQHEIFDSLANETVVKSEQRSRRFTISGIFKTNFADFDDKLSFVDIRQIRKLNYWDSSQVANYEIKVKDFDALDEDVLGLQDLLGYNFSVNSVRELYFNIFIWLEKLDMNGVIIVVLMIIVATINMITALLILILERTNMVGLVKALGMSNASVRRIFMLVSLRLTGRGMLWGNIAGISICLLQYFFRIASLNSETYYVDHVAIEINWLYFLLLNCGTFLVCALMLILPTLIITKLTPVKTLKFD